MRLICVTVSGPHASFVSPSRFEVTEAGRAPLQELFLSADTPLLDPQCGFARAPPTADRDIGTLVTLELLYPCATPRSDDGEGHGGAEVGHLLLEVLVLVAVALGQLQ